MKACSGTLWVYKILFITEFQQELGETLLINIEDKRQLCKYSWQKILQKPSLIYISSTGDGSLSKASKINSSVYV